MSEQTCTNCEEPLNRYVSASLPVSEESGEIVAVDFQGEWAGIAACETCVALHAAAGPHFQKVLDIYAKAQAELRRRFAEALGLIDEIRDKLNTAEGNI